EPTQMDARFPDKLGEFAIGQNRRPIDERARVGPVGRLMKDRIAQILPAGRHPIVLPAQIPPQSGVGGAALPIDSASIPRADNLRHHRRGVAEHQSSMTDPGTSSAQREVTRGSWGELFTGGRGLYSALIIGGIAMHATQILVIAIIMPTVVGDIGGAAYYTWAAMLYTMGSIVGSSSTGVVWSRLGAGKGYTLGASILALGTVGCALAPDVFSLIALRGIQGWAGGLVSGGGTALIASLYDARLRTRILAISQGTFTCCHLGGPVVGGIFAAMHWWRGSFWLMAPFMIAFAIIALIKIPARLDTEAERGAIPPFPFFRLTMLASGVCAVAAIGTVDNTVWEASCLILAVVLVAAVFRLDREAGNKLFPSHALSFRVPIGLCLWTLTLHAMAQTSVTLFLPLLLQVVHGVSPVFVN